MVGFRVSGFNILATSVMLLVGGSLSSDLGLVEVRMSGISGQVMFTSVW